MTIPVKHEKENFKDEDPRFISFCENTPEVCHFCKKTTRYWHENTNNPVCQECAKKHKVGELPDYGKRIRANKRRKKNG